MADFWNLIVQSNTFNFAILVVIFAVVFVKIDLSAVFEKIRNEVSKTIDDANSEKLSADKELKKVKKLVKNTDIEVEEKIKSAKLNAKTLSDEILLSAQKQIDNIEDNAQKIVNAEENKLSNELVLQTVNDAMKLAEQNLINILKENPALHEKFLDESIDEIGKIKL